MHFLLLCICGVLLTAIRLSAEVILPENWTLVVNSNRSASNYTDHEPLSSFVDVKDNAIFLKHPVFGIKCYAGNAKASPGVLRISFTASALSPAVSQGELKVVMYGYHFRDDNCTGKSKELFLKKDFSISGKKALSVDFNITQEQLKCVFCDEQVPTFRFFVTINLKEESPGIALDNVSVSAASPLLIWGRKQVSTTNWLLDELKADKAKDAERAALKKELETPTAHAKVVPKTIPAKKVEPVEVAIPIEKFVSHVEAEFPALFDAEIIDGKLFFDKKPSNRQVKITLALNPPAIPENFEYVVVLDRKIWSCSSGIYDANERPLDKDSGYLADGTLIMRLPYNCRKIDFVAHPSNSFSGAIKKIFYREIKRR